MRVLLVDDELEILEQAKIFLEKEDERLIVETAASAEDALKTLGEGDYDAVVSDYRMPGMDGLEFLRILREEKGSEIPFLIFTGKGREEIAMEALNLGADRYIRKGRDPRSQYGILARAIAHEVDRRRAEVDLEMARRAIGASGDSLIMADGRGEIIFCNRAACGAFGYSREELVGNPLTLLLPQELRESHEEGFRRAGGRGEISKPTLEGRGLRKDGSEFPAEFTLSSFEEGGRRVFVASIRDISERAEAREKLSFETNLLRSLLKNIPDSVYFKDEKNRFVEVSRSKADHLGVEKDEIVGKTDFDFYPEEQAKRMGEDDKRVMETGEPVRREERVTRPAGEDAWVSAIKAPRYDGEGNVAGTVGISRDITERKEAEEQYRKAIEAANVGIVLYGSDGDVRVINPKMEEITGYGTDELPTLDDWFEKLYPEEGRRSEVRSKWEETMSERGHVTGGEAEVTTKGGGRRTLRFNGVRLESGDSMAFAEDITERREAEEREEFLHSLLSHDLRNKAQIVQGYLELMRGSGSPGEFEEYLEKADGAVEDGTKLIEKVGALREIEEEKGAGEVSVDSAIREAVGEKEFLASDKGIEIKHERCECEVRGGPLLKELFSNLIENSVIHSGCSRVKISSDEAGDECVVTVEDDGSGIPGGDREAIFEGGFRKGSDAGSGLGLYFVREIARDYGGSVEVGDSELGGARFDVRLKKASGGGGSG